MDARICDTMVTVVDERNRKYVIRVLASMTDAEVLDYAASVYRVHMVRVWNVRVYSR